MSATNAIGWGQLRRFSEEEVNPESPGALSVPYRQMLERWDLIHDLLGGTSRMRDVGNKWLPLESKEKRSDYIVRLRRSFLFEGYKNGVDRVVAKPFSRPITVDGDEQPEWIPDLVKNADLQGRDLTVFGKAVFEDGVHHGLSHVFVDFPSPGDGVQTAEQERLLGLRPYYRHISAKDLIGWRPILIGGQHYVQAIRYREKVTVPVGSFGDREVEVITEVVAGTIEVDPATRTEQFRPGTVRRWMRDVRQSEKRLHVGRSSEQEWTPMGPPRPFTFPRPWLPIATFYTNFEAFMKAKPALEPLAWLNLMHWHSSSDQRNILRVARVGMIHLTGATKRQIEEGVPLSPFSIVMSENPEASLDIVGYSGTSIDAGRQDLLDIKDEMELWGLRPFMERRTTATARIIDEGAVDCDAQLWALELECALRQAANFWQIWRLPAGTGFRQEVELPQDLRFHVFDDFALSSRARSEVAELTTARKERLISHDTYINELRRRGTLTDSVDAEKERDLLDSEADRAQERLFQPDPVVPDDDDPSPAAEGDDLDQDDA